jgi:hypothetical protein
MTTLENLGLLKLSIQQALIGEVTQNLVAVTCALGPNRVFIKAYFSGKVTDADIDRIPTVGTEVTADMPANFVVEELCVSTDDEPEEVLDFWAFRRAKSSG